MLDDVYDVDEDGEPVMKPFRYPQWVVVGTDFGTLPTNAAHQTSTSLLSSASFGGIGPERTMRKIANLFEALVPALGMHLTISVPQLQLTKTPEGHSVLEMSIGLHVDVSDFSAVLPDSTLPAAVAAFEGLFPSERKEEEGEDWGEGEETKEEEGGGESEDDLYDDDAPTVLRDTKLVPGEQKVRTFRHRDNEHGRSIYIMASMVLGDDEAPPPPSQLVLSGVTSGALLMEQLIRSKGTITTTTMVVDPKTGNPTHPDHSVTYNITTEAFKDSVLSTDMLNVASAIDSYRAVVQGSSISASAEKTFNDYVAKSSESVKKTVESQFGPEAGRIAGEATAIQMRLVGSNLVKPLDALGDISGVTDALGVTDTNRVLGTSGIGADTAGRTRATMDLRRDLDGFMKRAQAFIDKK